MYRIAPNVRSRHATRSSSREVRIRVPFSVVYFSGGTLPQKKVKRALLGGLGKIPIGRANSERKLNSFQTLQIRCCSKALSMWPGCKINKWRFSGNVPINLPLGIH